MSNSNSMPRILLTGACGVLGRAIREAAKNQYELVCVDIIQSGSPGVHQGSFTDPELMRRLLQGCDVVIHTAALHGRHRKTHSPTQFMELNVSGLVTLLELCCELGIKRFVFSSTMQMLIGQNCLVAGATVLDEHTKPLPNDIYSVTKLLGENLGFYYHQQKNIEFIALRYMGFSARTVPSERLLSRAIMPSDVAEANLLAVSRPNLGYEVLNIGPDTPLTQKDILQAFTDPYGVVDKYWPGASAILKEKNIVLRCDHFWPVNRIDRAKRVLGWQPKVTFETYLQSLGWKKP